MPCYSTINGWLHLLLKLKLICLLNFTTYSLLHCTVGHLRGVLLVVVTAN